MVLPPLACSWSMVACKPARSSSGPPRPSLLHRVRGRQKSHPTAELPEPWIESRGPAGEGCPADLPSALSRPAGGALVTVICLPRETGQYRVDYRRPSQCCPCRVLLRGGVDYIRACRSQKSWPANLQSQWRVLSLQATSVFSRILDQNLDVLDAKIQPIDTPSNFLLGKRSAWCWACRRSSHFLSPFLPSAAAVSFRTVAFCDSPHCRR